MVGNEQLLAPADGFPHLTTFGKPGKIMIRRLTWISGNRPKQGPFRGNTKAMEKTFRIGLTRDFLNPAGELGYGDIGLELLENRDDIQWEFLQDHGHELSPGDLSGFDALLLLGGQITANSLIGDERLKVIARFGVGYDNVDVSACTEAGVLLTITPDGVRRAVASTAITFILALSHQLLAKDRLTRTNRWHERLDYMGQGLVGKTLGIVGLGNTGCEVFRLAKPFEMRHIGYDPYADSDAMQRLGVEVMELDDLLRESDYVVICCVLAPETRRLINADRLALMKRSAFVINVARGPIVDQAALTNALQHGTIRGAALDVFEKEPIDPDDPILSLENVIVTPHSLCWTDEMFLATGRSAIQSILDVHEGRTPKSVVNRELLGQQQLRARFTKQK